MDRNTEEAYIRFVRQEKENERIAKETFSTVLEMVRDYIPEGDINIRRILFIFARDGIITKEEKRLIEEYCKRELLEIELGIKK